MGRLQGVDGIEKAMHLLRLGEAAQADPQAERRASEKDTEELRLAVRGATRELLDVIVRRAHPVAARHLLRQGQEGGAARAPGLEPLQGGGRPGPGGLAAACQHQLLM